MIDVARDRAALDARSEAQQDRIRRQAEQERQRQEEKLKKANAKLLNSWEMELKYQQAINTLIGKDYPKPIVIHEEARASALKAFQSLKKN